MTALAWGILAFAVASLGAITTLAIMLSRAKDQRENNRVAAESNAKEIVALSKERDRLTAELTDTKEDLDAMETIAAEGAAGAPVAGAFERLLQEREARRARRDGARAVLEGETVRARGPDDLLPPGE